MPIIPRAVLALTVALACWFGARWASGGQASSWVVSPEQIAAARAAGKPGVETSPGTVAVLPIRSETAGLDPLLWTAAGLGAGLLTFAATGRRKPAP